MKKKAKLPSSMTVNINGDGNVVGDKNISSFRKIHQESNPSVQDFLSLLGEIEKLLKHSYTEVAICQKIETEVESVKQLITEPEPQKPTILGKLKHMEELVKTGLGLAALSTQLLPMIDKLTTWAKAIL